MRKSKLVFLLGVLLVQTIYGQSIKISSPDKNLQVMVSHNDTVLFYSASYKGNAFMAPSALSLEFEKGGKFGSKVSFGKVIHKHVEDSYTLVIGKSSEVKENYQELVLPVTENRSPYRILNLHFRVFNDGIAYRYEIPEQKSMENLEIRNEQSEFRFLNNPKVLTLFRENYTTSHEGIYSHIFLSDVKKDTLMDLPTLFEFGKKLFIGVTEANLVDYAGMYLIKKNGILQSALSPLPGGAGMKVRASLPHHSPWRVIMVSERVGGLIESNILTNLADPLMPYDWSWIKPGKTTFPWWNGNVTPDTNFAPGNNFETNKYYIDFCAKAGLEYHSVVEYGLHEWYVSDGTYFQPGPHTDATRAVPGLDIQQICDYAKTKGVGIRFWVHWKALYPVLDKAFDQYEKWGIKGMMVDFMDRDDQEMVNIQNEILDKAAKHHFHIQFHGAYKPTGRQRTYPNEFTREGTLNYENNKGSDIVGPDQDISIPFTRMLAGPTDYHLGGFRAVPRSKFKPQYTAPLMLGTRCHMLGMYVVLENPQGMVCDYPEAYLGQAGFEFIQKVPTVWDETRVPAAEVSEFITIARRKGHDWYLGSITNEKGRNLKIPLNFLGDGDFTAEIFSDAVDTQQNPNHLVKTLKEVRSSDILEENLAGGGGLAIRFIRH